MKVNDVHTEDAYYSILDNNEKKIQKENREEIK